MDAQPEPDATPDQMVEAMDRLTSHYEEYQLADDDSPEEAVAHDLMMEDYERARALLPHKAFHMLSMIALIVGPLIRHDADALEQWRRLTNPTALRSLLAVATGQPTQVPFVLPVAVNLN